MSDHIESRSQDAAGQHAHNIVYSTRTSQLWVLVALITVIASLAQWVGPLVIPIGIASITLLPMVWGILAGGFVSAQPWKRMPIDMQHAAGAIMAVAVLVLCARLSFTLGPNIGILLSAGPALLLQELGHLFGTILLALPLAVLLRMGPATIGATFSIDREASFAMVSERYGAESPQYRGVLSMYVFGTLFGAVLVSLIASLATSLDIFDPLALAMGAGVGSGSMMAAAAAVVSTAHPEVADQVLAVATASNLITSILGLYVGVFVALPMAEKFYLLLARGKFAVDTPVVPSDSGTHVDVDKVEELSESNVTIPMVLTMPILLAVAVLVSSIAHKGFTISIVGGYLVMGVLTLAGIALARLTRGKIPAIVWVITFGALSTTSISPVAESVGALVEAIDFLSVCTVVLTIAGLSLGKDLPMLRNIGWKIVPVGIVAIAASYLLSVVVAEVALGYWA